MKAFKSFFDLTSAPDMKPKGAAATDGQIEEIAARIKDADAIIIGAGSGMSSAAGYNHYHDNAVFRKYFGDFAEHYGFDGMFEGLYHLYGTHEEEWAYIARYMNFMYEAPTGKNYADLKEIIGEREYYILTTNVDMQFERVFPKERICTFQGDFGYFQCSQPCHDKLYPSEETVKELCANTENFRVPYDLIPRCPECGRIMSPWVRDTNFLEGEHWQAGYRAYKAFADGCKDKKVVFLELGVGDMTPSIIKLPFWGMTQTYKDAFYISVNMAKPEAPSHIADKSMAIAEDIASFLERVKAVI